MIPPTTRNPNAKGKALERAVRLIQETILRSDPNLKGTKFSVENNKKIQAGEVHHEIDVLVKTLAGTSYESTFIFECKNWQDAVGKNEVIILSEKVHALGANRGYLVARAITKDAEAQLAKDQRLAFVCAKEDFLSPFQSLHFTHVVHDCFPIRLFLKERGTPPRDCPEIITWKDHMCRFNGQPIQLSAFIKSHVDEMVGADQIENEVLYRNVGTHPGHKACKLTFEPAQFFIEDKEYEWMTLSIEFLVKATRPKLISKFEISGQGRVFSFESTELYLGKPLQIELIQRL